MSHLHLDDTPDFDGSKAEVVTLEPNSGDTESELCEVSPFRPSGPVPWFALVYFVFRCFQLTHRDASLQNSEK